MLIVHEALNRKPIAEEVPGSTLTPLEGQRPGGQELYKTLEEPSWAPWLRFEPEMLNKQASVFPDGQIVIPGDKGDLLVALSANKVHWDGSPNALTSWGDMAGKRQTYEDTYNPNGNTFVLMSMSSNPNARGQGLPGKVFGHIRAYAQKAGLEHIIGDFRPRDFGTYKKATGQMNFEKYCQTKRADGEFYDGWLRSVSRQGATFIKTDPRAMVIEASAAEVAQWQQDYNPSSWWEVTDPEQTAYLMKWHQPLQNLERVDKIMECGETGTWYIDQQSNKAVYIESNVWGQVPLEAPGTDKVMLESSTKSRYNLTEGQMVQLEGELVNAVKSEDHTPDVYVAWIGPDHKFANVIRTLEARQFPEVPNLVDDEIEKRSLFLALVDTRDGEDRVVHAARLSGLSLRDGTNGMRVGDSESTGFIITDELVRNGSLRREDFETYCRNHDIDPDGSISVETNFRVGEKVPGKNGLRISDLGYIAFFNRVEGKGATPNRGSVFATINEATRRSLGAIGIQWFPLASKRDVTGANKYELVSIPLSPESITTFRHLGSMVSSKEVFFP